MNTLELAKIEDLEQCNKIINAGKKFQQEQGFIQWTNDYPNIDTLREDIHDKKGYVLKVNGKIAGYMCIDFDGEPAYNKIYGAWKSEKPYAVMHRMSFSEEYRGMGLADEAFRLMAAVCKGKDVNHIRVDTDFPNQRMQHILVKNGFIKRGVIVFQDSEKLAYEKQLM